MAFGPFLGVNFAMYEKLKEIFVVDSTNIKFYQSFLMALSTGVVASLITNPLEVPKLRMQV